MRPGGLTLAALLLGCAQDVGGLMPTTPPAGPSGMQAPRRLRAQYLEADGGDRQFQGWFDTELATPCACTRADDGALYCLPIVPDLMFYGDSNCATPIYVPDCGTEAARFVRSTEVGPLQGDACFRYYESHSTFREVIGPRRETSTTYYFHQPGTCQLNLQGQAIKPFFALSEPVANTRFVRATRVMEPRTERVSAIVLVAEDGARQDVGIYDHSVEAQCSPTPPTCRPYDGTVGHDRGGPFRYDATCQHRVANIPADFCPPQAIVINVVDATGCSYATEIREVVEEIPASQVKTLNANGECVASEPSASTRAYALGALMTDRYSFLDVRTDGPARLQAATLESNGARFSLVSDDFIDTQRGIACRLIPQNPERLLCVAPNEQPLSEWTAFTDASCTIPAALLLEREDGCPSIPAYQVRSVYQGCGVDPLLEIRPVLGVLQAPAFELRNGACARLDPATYATPGYRPLLHALGEPVDLSTWPSVRRVTE